VKIASGRADFSAGLNDFSLPSAKGRRASAFAIIHLQTDCGEPKVTFYETDNLVAEN
jgi:hypothetical protein